MTSLLRVELVARELRVPVRWLRAEALAGRVPALNAGGVLLLNTDAVRRALLPRAVKQAAPRAKAVAHD